MFSLDECVPKRPPRAQKLPLASGTVQLATPIGRASLVISAIQSICRASVHSFTSDSSTMATKSRALPSLSRANSPMFIFSSGKAVCAPTLDGIVSRPTSGNCRLAGGGSTEAEARDVHSHTHGNPRPPTHTVSEPSLVGAVAEVHSVCRRACRDRAVQLNGCLAGGAGLLAGEAEVANKTRRSRITQIIDLRHAPRSPALDTGHEVGDPGITLPPALVRALERPDA